MDTDDRVWLEAAARVQSDLDAEARQEAREVFVAEAARCRLADRVGDVRLTLRCGTAVDGVLVAEEPVAGHLTLRDASGRHHVIPAAAVVTMRRSRTALRPEGADEATPITQWLREAWAVHEAIRLLDSAGTSRTGVVSFVGADHVELHDSADSVVIPLAAVEMWSR